MSARKRANQRLKAKRRNSRAVDGQAEYAKPTYMHPAHPYRLTPVEKSAGWHCDICHFLQAMEGEQRQRYRSVNPDADYNICGDCMSAEYSAWHAKKEIFFNGGAIGFSGLRYMGQLPTTDDWPAPEDRAGHLEIIDKAQREGDLPWRSSEARELHLSPTRLTLAVDPQNINAWERYTDPKVYFSWSTADIASITTIDDSPVFVLCIRVGPIVTRDEEVEASCHFLQLLNSELGDSICEVSRNAFDFVYTQSLVEHVDDCILAGIEGRPTAVEKQAEDRANVLKMKQQMGFDREYDLELRDGSAQMSSDERQAKHMSVFQLFDLDPVLGNSSPEGSRASSRQSNRRTPDGLRDAAPLFARTRSPSPASLGLPPPSANGPSRSSSVSTAVPGGGPGSMAPSLLAPPSFRDGPGSSGAPSHRSESPSSRGHGPDGAELSDGALTLVQNYMRRLQNTLSTTELKQFAALLREYRVQSDFKHFSSELLDLYGPNRLFLLQGMEAFVPTNDRPKFQLFLEEFFPGHR